jgi:membrane protein
MLGLSRSARRRAMAEDGAGRGRAAGRPSDIPKAGWRDILLRVWREQSEDNISMIAAGVAFYMLLALFPTLAAMVSIYGLVADPAEIERQFGMVSSVLPQEATDILLGQMRQVAGASGGALQLSVLVSLALTLWSASRGMNALINALNITYDERETRGFIKLNLIALGLTLGGIVFLILTLVLVAGLPAVFNALGLGGPVVQAVSLARWPLLAVAGIIGLAVLYRYAPDRQEPRWRWVSWGAILATLLWLLGSIAFSVYVGNFSNYNETYGSVGAVVILLLWLNLTAYVVLLGAELNAEMEHQTAQDTTTGGDQPIGHRRAYVADTVGNQP